MPRPLTARSRFVTTAAFLVGLTLASSACTGDPDPDGAELSPSASPPAGSSCAQIAAAMTNAFPDFALVEDEGRFSLGDQEGRGCRTLVAGTAEELPTFVEVSETLRALLVEAGWTEDVARAADGPTGTLVVYERSSAQGGEMAVVAAGASPIDPASCRQDEVISACFERLDPAEIEVHGSITVAEASAD